MTRAKYFVPDFKTNIVTNIGTPVNPTDAANKAYADGKVSKTGDVMTGNLDMQQTAGWRYIRFSEGTSPRWEFGKGIGPSGNLIIDRFNTSGFYLDTPFMINQNTGEITTNPLTAPFLTSTGGMGITRPPGSSANMEFRTNALLRWTMGKGPGAEAGSNAGAEFNIAAWDDAGNWKSNPISINRANSFVTFDADGNGISTPWIDSAYGGWFGANVICDSYPINDNHLTSKLYVDTKISGSIWVQAAAPVVSTPPTGYPLWLDTDEGEVSVALGNRNRVINGDFSVNQRGFASASGGGYGADRWMCAPTGGTVTYSLQTPALGELPESASRFARITTAGQAAVGDYSIFIQYIESVRSLSGKTVTVSFWAKAASGTPKVVAEFAQGFGTGGSPSATSYSYGGQVTVSTSWTRYSITGVVPSVAGKTLGTNGNDYLGVFLWTSGGSSWNARTNSIGIQNSTIDFWGVQVEEGAVATPYEKRTYADEIRACQRYFYRIQGTADVNYMGYAGIGAGNVLNTTSAFISIALPTAMRGKPTVTTGGVTLWNGTVEKPVTGINTVYWSPLSPGTCFLDLLTSGLTVGQALVAYTSRNTSSYLEFNVEF